MIIYQITINIDKEIEKEWIAWMQNVHIPDVLITNKFFKHEILKSEIEIEKNYSEYCIQYFADSMKDYEDYIKKFAPELQAKHTEKFIGKFSANRKLVEC